MYNRSSFKTFAALFAIAFSPFVIADESVHNDKIIVITANRTEQDINDTLAAVEVITREDIERIQPTSITDLLESVAGLDIVHNGGAGQASSLFTRGTNSDHTLILVDGVRVGSATLGNKSFSSMPVAQIERIEVVKGPRASLWGSDAIGGVIQIFTRRLKQGEYSVQTTIGSNNSAMTDLSFGFGSDKITNTVTFSYEKSGGFDAFDDSSEFSADSQPDDDGFDRTSAAIRGDYEISPDTDLDWVFQLDQGNSEFDNNFGADETDYENYFWNIRYSYTVDQWLTQFSVKQSRDNLENIAEGPQSVFDTKRNQFNLLTQYQLSDGISFTGGLERFTDDLSNSKNIQFDEEKRSTESAFISTQMKFGKFVTEAALRRDEIELVDEVNSFNVSLGYHIIDNLIIAASRAKGFKAPTFNDLYFPGFGNKDLISEESFNNEFLVRWKTDNHQLLIALFENKVDQLIAFKFDPDVGFAPFNVDQAELSGYEIGYQNKMGRLTHKFTASHVDATDKSIDPFTGQPKDVQLIRRAKEHYGYELIADLGTFSFFAQLNYIGNRPDTDFNTFQSVTLKSFINVNLGGTYHYSKQLKFKFKISDYTDAQAPSIANYNAPGQQVSITIQYLSF
jgi:vitamin B12 transporter